ncbi:MAG: sigma-54-dependent Fis family transcriptional regulator [Nitrospinae bacterium]|nr:sigma-54-dependent Fis family transcriptional regulator [Nitrospinota bacterium]
MSVKVLTVDDDINVLKSIEELLNLKKHRVFPHISPQDALANFDDIQPDLAVVDYYMPMMTGMDLMRRFHEKRPDMPVVILTASREVNDAIEAIKAGAYHYLTKPVQADELFSLVDKISEQAQLKEENERLKEELGQKYKFDSIIGRSGALQDVFTILNKAIRTKSTILITGESGTGKELIARAAHYNSTRSVGPFIKVNCAAIPETMLEAELFGIEKNIATGVAQRPGKFELADGGSIFMDEVGEMSPATQAKVLRVLQEREVERIGSSKSKKVDIRVIAATNIDIMAAVADKKFRSDLFYRLNVFHIHMPPLSKRAEDIPMLAVHFSAKYCEENGLPLKKIDSQAVEHLQRRRWPGNIRELENTIERAVGVAEGETIRLEDVREEGVVQASEEPEEQGDGQNLDERVAAFERKILLASLERNHWRQNKAAKEMEITERSIWYKIKKLGIAAKKPDDGEE